MMEGARCINCLEKDRGKARFRGGWLCSAQCNNQWMGRLRYQREKAGGEKRWVLGIDNQRLERGNKRGWVRWGGIVLGWEYALGCSFCHCYVRMGAEERDIETGIAIPGVAVWVNLELPWKYKGMLTKNYEMRKTGIAIHGGSIWMG